jgi:VWFA-related protein
MPDYSIKVDVPLVNLDVLVTTKDGQTIPGLKQENFKIFEDGTPQKIATFNKTETPITAVLLVEFASTNYSSCIEALNASYAFANTLKKDDWVAVISYDMKPQILADFTQDKRAVYAALEPVAHAGFLGDEFIRRALRHARPVDRIEGKKYIILVTTGVDTFSKLTLDKILKKVKSTKDVTIYPISVGFVARILRGPHGRAGPAGIPVGNMDYLQADNEMKTFASLTGGRAYFPRFQGELPEIFNDIGADIRNQYSISYHPTNTKLDGTYRKLKVELQAPDGGPLKIRDQKGKDVKIDLQSPVPPSGESAVIPRYTRPEMARIWSDENRFRTWLAVEVAATETLAAAGIVPKEAAKAIHASAPTSTSTASSRSKPRSSTTSSPSPRPWPRLSARTRAGSTTA